MAFNPAAPGTQTGPSRSGRLNLFGHDPTPATVRVLRRSRRWRTVRALKVAGIGVVAAPVLALVPPHAPWALGALIGSLFLARRRLLETHTLVGLEGSCPHCGEAVTLEAPARLRLPHPVSCEACHHEVTLRVEGALGD